MLWGGIATYLEAPDKLFLLVAEEEVREHIQKQSLISFIFLGQCADSLFAPVCAFILSHGSWFADFWSLSPCLGDSKIRDFSPKV